MNRAEAAIAITNEFISNFNDSTPVYFENQGTFYKCTSPRTPSSKPTNSIYVEFDVVDNSTSKRTLGTKGHRRFRRTGIVSAKVLVPEGVGTSDGRDMCQEIIDIFEGERIASYIVFTDGNYVSVGNIGTGWYQFNVIIHYSFDEPK